MKVLRLIIFISFIPALILLVGPGTTGCSGGGGGGGGAETTETTQASAEIVPAEIPDDDVLRETYEVTPDAFYTMFDIITKDRLDGKISAEDALEQKLFYFYDSPYLRDEYKQLTNYADLPSGTGLLQKFLGELARLDPDAQDRVIAVWEAIIEGTPISVSPQAAPTEQVPATGDQSATDAAQAAVAAAQQALQVALQEAQAAASSPDQEVRDAAQAKVAAAQADLQAALEAFQAAQQAAASSKSAIPVAKAVPYVSKAAPAGGAAGIFAPRQFKLPDGSCFEVEKVYAPLVRGVTAKDPFVADGKKFEIFYNNQTAAMKEMVKTAFTTQGFVQKIKANISDLEPWPYDASAKDENLEYCNPTKAYRMFMTPVKTAFAAVTAVPSDPGRSADIDINPTLIIYSAPVLTKGYGLSFIRYNRTQPWSVGQDLVNGVTTHEWEHATSRTINIDRCEEAHASAAEVWFSQSKAYMRKFPFLLYAPAASLCGEVNGYGSSLFFVFLKDEAQDFTPIQAYKKSLLATRRSGGSTGSKFLTALEAASAPGDFPSTFHKFAEASLNLKYSDVYKPPEDYRFTGPNHPNYSDEFLAAGGIPNLPLTWGTYRQNLKFQLLPLGILYLAAVTGEGNNWNNYFKFTVNKWDGGFSVFGIKIDNNNPQNYTIVYHKKYGGSPMEACFDKVDNEPDILILVFSNPSAPGTKDLAADVTIESRAFCKAFPLEVKVDRTLNAPLHQLKSSAKLTVTMDSKWEREWIGPPTVSWPGLKGGQVKWESTTTNDNGAESSIAWSSGTPVVKWSHEETEITNIGACQIKVTTSPAVDTTLNLDAASDIVKLNVWPWGAPNFNLQPGAFYVSEFLKDDGAELSIPGALKQVTTCTGSCTPAQCTADEAYVGANIVLPDWGWNAMALMTYGESATTLAGYLELPKSDPNNQYEPTVINSWTINTPEPLEAHRATRYIQYWPESGLSYPDKLSYEIIAPVIDELYAPQIKYLKQFGW
jgi:hypothetical protein